jgi:hypothetical protein
MAVKADKVMKQPNKYFGKSVSITAPIGNVMGEQVIALDSGQEGRDLLVLLPRAASQSISGNQKVTVTGTLREFVDADVYIDHRMAKAQRVEPGEIAKAPDQYYGKTVRIDDAEIERVESAHLFLIDEDELTAGTDLVVINPRPQGSVPSDDEVEIVGKVRPFVEAELEREYDWLDLDPQLVLTLQGRPVVIADSVKTEAGTELVSKQQEPQPAMGR